MMIQENYQKTLDEINKLSTWLNEIMDSTRNLHLFFKDYIVYTKFDWNNLLNNFLAFKSPQKIVYSFKVYPYKIRYFAVEQIRDIKPRVLGLREREKNQLYSLEFQKISTILKKTRADFIKALEQLYTYRNHILFWVYHTKFEIVKRTGIYLIRYNYFNNKCENYWAPYKMKLTDCIGKKYFTIEWMYSPIFSYKEPIKFNMWLSNVIQRYVDFILTAEPIFFKKYFILDNRAEKLMYFLDFQNGTIRLAKRILKETLGLDITYL